MKIQNVSLLFFASLLSTAAIAAPARAEPSAATPDPPAVSIGSAATQDTPLGQRSSGSAGRTRQAAGRGVPRFALALNPPVGWFRGLWWPLRSSFGASLSVGLTRHHAIRTNVARYDGFELLPLLLAAADLQGPPAIGSVVDASIGWVYYPRRLFDGFMLEAGVLRRERDVEEFHLFEPGARIQSVTHAGRATVGWSWPIGSHLFVSTAAGVSVGRETGTRNMTAIDRVQVHPELYVRFGLRFGR